MMDFLKIIKFLFRRRDYIAPIFFSFFKTIELMIGYPARSQISSVEYKCF